jgi:hypothetical protein
MAMKNSVLRGVFLLTVGLFVSSCIFSTSRTTVKGFVREQDGKPVADAEINFGGALTESKTRSGADGSFTVSASHRPTQMLTLTVSKSGFAETSEKFPGFAAPKDDKIVVLKPAIPTIPRTR